MPIHPANARELANIAQEVGAVVIDGALRYPSETGSWASFCLSTATSRWC
jgi:hypothetical protein